METTGKSKRDLLWEQKKKARDERLRQKQNNMFSQPNNSIFDNPALPTLPKGDPQAGYNQSLNYKRKEYIYAHVNEDYNRPASHPSGNLPEVPGQIEDDPPRRHTTINHTLNSPRNRDQSNTRSPDRGIGRSSMPEYRNETKNLSLERGGSPRLNRPEFREDDRKRKAEYAEFLRKQIEERENKKKLEKRSEYSPPVNEIKMGMQLEKEDEKRRKQEYGEFLRRQMKQKEDSVKKNKAALHQSMEIYDYSSKGRNYTPLRDVGMQIVNSKRPENLNYSFNHSIDSPDPDQSFTYPQKPAKPRPEFQPIRQRQNENIEYSGQVRLPLLKNPKSIEQREPREYSYGEVRAPPVESFKKPRHQSTQRPHKNYQEHSLLLDPPIQQPQYNREPKQSYPPRQNQISYKHENGSDIGPDDIEEEEDRREVSQPRRTVPNPPTVNRISSPRRTLPLESENPNNIARKERMKRQYQLEIREQIEHRRLLKELEEKRRKEEELLEELRIKKEQEELALKFMQEATVKVRHHAPPTFNNDSIKTEENYTAPKDLPTVNPRSNSVKRPAIQPVEQENSNSRNRRQAAPQAEESEQTQEVEEEAEEAEEQDNSKFIRSKPKPQVFRQQQQPQSMPINQMQIPHYIPGMMPINIPGSMAQAMPAVQGTYMMNPYPNPYAYYLNPIQQQEQLMKAELSELRAELLNQHLTLAKQLEAIRNEALNAQEERNQVEKELMNLKEQLKEKIANNQLSDNNILNMLEQLSRLPTNLSNAQLASNSKLPLGLDSRKTTNASNDQLSKAILPLPEKNTIPGQITNQTLKIPDDASIQASAELSRSLINQTQLIPIDISEFTKMQQEQESNHALAFTSTMQPNKVTNATYRWNKPVETPNPPTDRGDRVIINSNIMATSSKENLNPSKIASHHAHENSIPGNLSKGSLDSHRNSRFLKKSVNQSKLNASLQSQVDGSVEFDKSFDKSLDQRNRSKNNSNKASIEKSHDHSVRQSNNNNQNKSALGKAILVQDSQAPEANGTINSYTMATNPPTTNKPTNTGRSITRPRNRDHLTAAGRQALSNGANNSREIPNLNTSLDHPKTFPTEPEKIDRPSVKNPLARRGNTFDTVENLLPADLQEELPIIVDKFALSSRRSQITEKQSEEPNSRNENQEKDNRKKSGSEGNNAIPVEPVFLRDEMNSSNASFFNNNDTLPQLTQESKDNAQEAGFNTTVTSNFSVTEINTKNETRIFRLDHYGIDGLDSESEGNKSKFYTNNLSSNINSNPVTNPSSGNGPTTSNIPVNGALMKASLETIREDPDDEIAKLDKLLQKHIRSSQQQNVSLKD